MCVVLCCVVLCCVVWLCVWLCVSVCCCVLVQDLGAPPNPLPAGPPKISLFFPSPATMFFLSPLSLCLLEEFWWCMKRRGMCTFRVLGLSCEAPAAPKLRNTTKIPRKDPQEREERKLWWKREKRAEFWATHPSGPPPFGAPRGLYFSAVRAFLGPIQK